MSWEAKFQNITWAKFCESAYNLSQKITTSKRSFDLIVAIARGGLTLSQLLSDQLKLPIAAFTVESYKDLKQAKLPHIIYGLSASLTNKKILLVDDVCDTGKTFLRGLAYLEEIGADRKLIMTASLHRKPHAVFKPDFFIAETSAWIIYPYEVRETIEQVITYGKKVGKTKAELKKQLLRWGFPLIQVKYFV